MLSTVEAGRPQPFEKLALVGDGLLYIETGRIKTAGNDPGNNYAFEVHQ